MKLCNLKDCTGCMACYNACPFDAIKINTDKLGRIYPEIIKDKCKDCKKCEKACPSLNPVLHAKSEKAYAAYTNNVNDRHTCASGGIATVISRYFIENGDVVFGSAFGDDNNLQIVMATSDDDIEKLKGSKYVYSFPGYSYRQVKKCLNDGKKCVFFGTPCQIAGLKGYLQGDDENVLTVDLVCHGTPPMSYLNEYLDYLKVEKGSKVGFRGENGFKFCVIGKDGNNSITRRFEEDLYYYSFMKGLTYREICYVCPYANQERCSDLTIGDFWGLRKDALDGYTGRVSVILINTQKGKDYFDKIKNRITFEEREVSEAINGNPQLQSPSKVPGDRSVFEKVYVEKGFVKGVKATNIYKTIIKYKIKNFILYYPRIIKNKSRDK